MNKLLRTIFLLPIIFYQRCISPFTPSVCRFHPTCSEYAKQAFLNHGIIKASYFTVKRILKCHPFYSGPPVDPVPNASKNRPECPQQDGKQD